MNDKKVPPPILTDSLRDGNRDSIVIVDNCSNLTDGIFFTDGYYFILFCTSGSAQLEYDGMQIALSENDVIMHVLRHGVIRNFCASPDFGCYQIWINTEELNGFRQMSVDSTSQFMYLQRSPLIHVTEGDAKLFCRYFHLLSGGLEKSADKVAVIRPVINTLMLELMSVIQRSMNNGKDVEFHFNPNAGARERSMAETFIHMVEQNDGHIRKVSYYASQMCVSPQYLSEIVYQTVGQRPQDIIRYFTIKAIERRLLYTEMSMQEITEDVGFPNSSFLGRYFKNYTGVTPMQYRHNPLVAEK